MRWFSVLVFFGVALGQEAAPPNGPRRVVLVCHPFSGQAAPPPHGHALVDAAVHLLIGRFVSVGQEAPPAGARVWDCAGRHVYAGFLDLWVEVDAPPFKGTHWNPLITPERRVRELDDATAKELRELGFAAALLAPRGGILRGQVALVSTAPRDPDPSERPPPVLADEAGQAVGFDRTRDGFPTSEMGAIAAIRQALIDGVVPPPDPLFFDTSDELQCLRAAKIAKEFDRAAILIGSGTEFRRLDAIAADGFLVVVPLRFPRAPDVSSPGALEAADLRDLMTWEQAPTNPRRLDAAGVPTALTSSKLEKRGAFVRNLREAVRHGLAPERALAMLTTNPADMLDAQAELGTIEAGKWANLVVAEGPLFTTEARILEVWIDGKRHEIETGPDLAGEWTVETAPPGPPTILKIDRRSKITVRSGDAEERARQVRVVDRRLSFHWDAPSGMAMFTATVKDGAMRGTGMRADGARFTWTATRTGPPPPSREKEPPPPEVPESFGLPFGPYAVDAPAPRHDLLIVQGATIWTCGPQGVIENGQLVVRKGKVDSVGPAGMVDAEGAVIVDAKGKHVTPGIVDCHSHTGISGGVNDAGQAVTAEVRIGDVTDPDDISWYRQLAGGVTAANSLHGSANPIGGQNQVVKLRWGVAHPDGMHFEGAPPGIKFALGENVKQSNRSGATPRFPQSRTGRQVIMAEPFTAAQQ